MRNKDALRKKNILSVRITDVEMEQIQELMETARMSASELIREALLTYAPNCGRKSQGVETGVRAA